MAFELSFSPEFFIAPHDLDGVEFDRERPVSVFQAISAMSEDDWKLLCEEVFNCEPDFVNVEMVLTKVKETNTCSDLRTPVEVWIDSEGWHRVKVF